MHASQGYVPPPIIVKQYAINVDGITGDQNQERMAIIYEDSLPFRKFTPSYTTLGERIDDYQFIRYRRNIND